MKRVAYILLLLSLLVALPAKAYDFKKSYQGNTLYFSVLSGDSTVAIVAPNGRQEGWLNHHKPSGRLMLPADVQYDGQRYRVVAIDDNAFLECEAIISVAIPRSVNFLGNNSFGQCNGLKTVVFDCDSLGEAYNAFVGCNAIDSVVLSLSVRKMPPFLFSEFQHIGTLFFRCEDAVNLKNLFFGCKAETDLVVGANVRRIPDFVFYNFVGLKTIEYENDGISLTEIGECAFVNCTGIKYITIPAGIRKIGQGAFAHCSPHTFFFAPQAAPAAAAAFIGIDKNTGVIVPCMSLESYAHSAIGRYFEVLEHKDECDETFNRLKIIYIHDTIIVHDTLFIGRGDSVRSDNAIGEVQPEETPDEDEEKNEDEEDEPWIFIDGKTVRIAKAIEMRGVGIRVFDEKGRMVVDERIPQSQPVDNYYIRLPKRQRYFMRFDMGAPIMIDVEKQEIH